MEKRQLVDQLMDAYVHWREASARVSEAYRSWAAAPAPRAAAAFSHYRAALDHEERAAETYAGLVGRVSRALSHHRSPPVDGARSSGALSAPDS